MYRIILSKDDMLQPEVVKKWIMNNDKAVKKAAIVIYQQQDGDEKAYGFSTKVNNRGFNRVDAPFLMEFAERCISGCEIPAKTLIKARYLLVKYSTQIANITNAKKNIQYEWDLKDYYRGGKKCKC